MKATASFERPSLFSGQSGRFISEIVVRRLEGEL
jgi:hypothetical protein